MLPKIKFDYSMPLDCLFTRFLGKKYDEAKQTAKAEEYLRLLDEYWGKVNDKVFKEIENASGIKWRKEKITCYLVKHSLASISKPLIVKIGCDLERTALVLVHELVHKNLSSKKHEDCLKLLQARLKNQSAITRRHVIVNLVLLKVVPKLFGKTCFKRMLKKDCKLRDYAKAWKLAFGINGLDGENIWKKIEEYAVELF